MRITCPNCGATYDVPEAKLVGRKAVRCSRCGTDWTPIAPEPPEPEEAARTAQLTHGADTDFTDDALEPVDADDHATEREEDFLPRPSETRTHFSAMERLARATEPPPPSIWLRIAWGLSVVLVAVMLWSAFNWRNDIMRIWPPSTRAYAALGLAHPPK